ncbi:helix-turn-helix transcriptional regulator [uncultured Senegalimassilia sp.]|uniref:helix-turn-helix transcriptional regulator n=1 Tax=uncultured Senegalimassilia sp. TaxID=1714350 RepID=UPI002671BB4B|nr:helix-turn-helix transcriptional regulator [uncultured Senegalimassilia sp.]
MGVRVPRITLKADFGDESAFGELSMLSVGYGLHQAWVFATMFGTASVFGAAHTFNGIYNSSVSLPYLISSCIYVCALLFMALTNQRFLKAYTTRTLLCVGACLSCAGTLLLMAPPSTGFPLFELISGIMTGIGSATLIIYWGTAFARCDSASIVLNTAVAITISIVLFASVLHYAPFPISGTATALVPLLELAILWKKTPDAYFNRNDVPIFKPLPINRGKFIVRFGMPVLALGIALGLLRSNSLQNLVMNPSVGTQPMLMLAAGCATVIVLVTIMALGGSDRWSHFFQPLVPFVAVTMFFIPFASTENYMLTSVFLLVGFLCFESLMWIFFGDLSQRFRLSPVFVFGLGRGILAFAIIIGTLAPVAAVNYVHALPFGGETVVVLMLLVIMFAYALLPREREIEAIVAPCPLVKAVSESFESQRESARVAQARNCGEAHGMTRSFMDAVQRERAGEHAGAAASSAQAGAQAASQSASQGTASEAAANVATGTANASVEGASHQEERADAHNADAASDTPGTSAAAENAASPSDAAPDAPAAVEGAASAQAQQPAQNGEDALGNAAATSSATASATASPALTHSASASSAAGSMPASSTAFVTVSRTPLTQEPTAKPANSNDAVRGGGRFRGKCETVANTFLLSRRETEILFFLAKGHNTAYIQEKLYISEGTAKTHIRHIYRKCDVHNQQDLMRMVEDAQPTE